MEILGQLRPVLPIEERCTDKRDQCLEQRTMRLLMDSVDRTLLRSIDTYLPPAETAKELRM